MHTQQAGPPAVSETYLNFIARLYFDAREMTEARRRYQESGSYAQAIAYLVGCGDDMRHTPAFCTIPGGKVIVSQPDRPEGSLAYVSLPLVNLAQRAFPDPGPRPECETVGTGGEKRQLGFWNEDELASGGTGTPTAAAKRVNSPRQKRLTYIERPIAQRYGQPVPGWVAKDRGLGYLVEHMRSADGYLVSLIHLKSRRALAEVISTSLDHERIREWVSACALLTDWNQGIQAILKEKPGKQKRLAWSRQLGDIWSDQQTKVKRLLAFF